MIVTDQKEAVPAEAVVKKGITLGKGKIPEEKVIEEKPMLRPPTLITPEVVDHFAPHAHTHTLHIFIFDHNYQIVYWI